MRRIASVNRGIMLFAAAVSMLGVPRGYAASGAWTGAAGAAWTNDANWTAAPYPSGLNTATFNGAGNGNTTVDLGGLPSIRAIIMDSAGAAPYTLGAGGTNAQTLVWESGGLIALTNGVVNTQTVAAALQLGTTMAAGSYTSMNASVGSTLVLAGNVAGAPSGGTAGAKRLVFAGGGEVRVGGGIANGGAAQLDLVLAGSNTLSLSGINTFSGNVAVNGAGTLSVSKLGNRYSSDSNLGAGTNVSFGASVNYAKLRYTGAGETSDRTFTLSSTSGSTLTIILEQSGSGPLVLTGNITQTTSNGNRQLRLQGDAAAGELAGVFSDYNTARSNSLYKTGTGTWTLSGSNLFKGAVTIYDGVLRLTPTGTLGTGAKVVTIAGDTTSRKPSLQLAGGSGSIVLPPEITFRTSNKQTGAIINESGTNTVQGGIELTSGDNDTHIWSYAGKLTLSGGIKVVTSERGLNLRGNGDGEISGVIENGVSTGMPVSKDVGLGTWTLTGANLYSGATTAGSGTLAVSGASGSINASASLAVTNGAVFRLDNRYDANNGDRVGNAAAVALSQGAFVFANNGGTADYSETAGALSVKGAGNAIVTSQAAEGHVSVLTFASLTRSGNATLTLTGEGLGKSDRNRIFVAGLAGPTNFPWISINGSPLPAQYDPVRGFNSVGVPDTDIAAYGDVIVSNGESNVQIIREGTNGPIALSDDVTVIRTLTQNTGFSATVDTASRALRADYLVIPSGMAGLTIGQAANDGTFAPATPGGSLGLVNSGTAALTLNATVADNGAAAALSTLGSGPVILAASNTFSGSTSVSNGTLVLANAGALQNSTLTSGGVVFDSSVAGHAFTLGNLAGTFSLTLADNAGTPNPVALYAGNNGASATFGGALGGAGSLTKIGAGTTTLAGTNTYGGGTVVSAGTLAVTGASGLGLGGVVNGATLNLLAGSVTYSGLSTALSGAGTVNVTLGSGTGTTTLSGDTSGFTGTWNIGVNGTGGKALMNGADQAAAVINVLSNGTLYCNTPTVHQAALRLNGGNNGESFGQLRLEGYAEWAGPVSLAADITDSTDGFFGGNSGNTGTVSGVVSDIGGAHAVNKVGGGRVFFTCPSNTFAGPVWCKGGSIGAAAIGSVGEASSLGKPASAADGAIKLGSGSSAARLIYVGAGNTTDRAIDMAATTADAIVDHEGSGLLRFTANVGYSGAGNKTLNLDGNTDGVGELAGVFADAPGYTNSLYKTGTGKWVLSGVSTHSGETQIQGGTLTLSHPNALSGPNVVRLMGLPSRSAVLELAHDGTAETPLNVTVGVGYCGTVASGVGSGSAGINHTLAGFNVSAVTVNVVRASDVLSGSPSVTAGLVNLSGGGAYTTTFNPSTADLIFGDVGIFGSGGFKKVLKLDGTSAANRITGVISNGLNMLSVEKSNVSTWTLTGANVYTGTTAVTGGTLALGGAGGAILNTLGISLAQGGTLVLDNAGSSNGNRLADAAPVAMNGGTVRFSHAADSADYSETAGALTVGSASNVVAASQAGAGGSSALTFASLALAGGALDFSGDGLGEDGRNQIRFSAAPALVAGIIGPWATVNGDAFATYGAWGVTAYAGGYSNIAARAPSTVPDDANAHVKIVDDGAGGLIALAAAFTNSVGTLKQTHATIPATVDTASKTLLTSGLLIAPGASALTVGGSAGDGAVSALVPGGSLTLGNSSASALTVNAALVDNALSSLNKIGSGNVILSGTCSYAGQTVVAEGSLSFASDAGQVLTGAVSGGGTLVKDGAGVLRLMATNTCVGDILINSGVLQVNENAALGTPEGATFIAAGGTLDVGCTADVGGTRAANALSLSSEQICAQGDGAGGMGAIMNSSTVNQQNAVGNLRLTGNARFGGLGRWDIRSGTLDMNGNTIVKVGTNNVVLSSSTVVANPGHILLSNGLMRIESSTKMNGSEANTFTVCSGSRLELYKLTAPVLWSLILNDSTTFAAAYTTDAAGQNKWAGPISLSGAVAVDGGSGNVADLAGPVSGTGSLTKTGSASITVSGTNNTYSGATAISGGRLIVPSLKNVGAASSLGQPATAPDGAIRMGSGSTGAALEYVGPGDVTDRAIDMAGSSGGATLYNSGTGPLTLAGGLSSSVAGSKSITLRGLSASAAEIAGNMSDGSGTIGVAKYERGTWILSGTNAFSGDMNVYNGTLVHSASLAQGSGNIKVGNQAASNAVLRVRPGSAIAGTGALLVGSTSGGSGALYVEDASVTRSPPDDQSNFGIGYSQNSYGYFNMSGGLVSNTRFQLGGTDDPTISMGIARITGGTLAFRTWMLIGRITNCVGVLTLDGGAFYHTNATQNIALGYDGGRGEINLTGGALYSAGRSLSVRQYNIGVATGIVNLCAGTLAVNSFTNKPGLGVAIVNFSGATLKACTNSTIFLPDWMTYVNVYGPFGAYAGGAVIDTDGRNVTVSAPLRAPAGNGVSSVVLASPGSGYIGEPYVSIWGGDGLGATAVANMEDDGTGNGTYRVASVTVTSPGFSYTSAPSVSFSGGGTTNQAVAATVNLLPNASGGLTKRGAGTLTLSGTNTYSGMTTIENGTLRLGIANALPANAPVTLAGGTYDLGGFMVTNALSIQSGVVSNGSVYAELSPAGAGAIGVMPLSLASVAICGNYIADVAADGASDCVAVQGSVNLSGLSLQLVNPLALNRSKRYTLLTCTESLSGALTPLNLPDSRWHLSYGADGTVKLIFVNGTTLLLK